MKLTDLIVVAIILLTLAPLANAAETGAVTGTADAAELYEQALEDFKLDRYAEAITVLEPLVKADPENADAMLLLARSHLERFRLEEKPADLFKAKQLATTLNGLIPGSADHAYLEGKIAFATGDMEAAEAAYRKGLEADPDHSLSANGLAIALSEQDKRADALAFLEGFLRAHPHDAVALYNLGCLLAHEGRTEEAALRYRQAIDERPWFASPYNNLGCLAFQQDKFDEAARAFAKVTTLRPDSPLGWHNVGCVRERQGQYEQAIEAFSKVAELRPDATFGHSRLGHACELAGDYDQAVLALERLASLRPEAADVRFRIGYLHEQLGQFDEAETAYKQVLMMKPDSATAYTNLGNVYLRQHEIERAVETYNRALEVNPAYKGAHYNLGTALLEAGRYDEALEQLTAAVRHKPDDARAHNNIGNLYFIQGRLKDAVDAYQLAIKHAPDEALFHSNLATAQYHAKDLDAAAKVFETAIARDPALFDARYNYGLLLYEQGRYTEAVAQLTEAVKLSESAAACNNLGNAQLMAGDADAAIKSYQRALELNSRYVPAWKNRGAAFMTQKEYRRAIEAYTAVIELEKEHQNPENFYYRGLAYDRASVFDKARADYENYVRLAPDGPHADAVRARLKQLQPPRD